MLVGKRAGCAVRRLVGAVFWRMRPGREGASLKGSWDEEEGRRVGEGRSRRWSSSSSSSKIQGSRDEEFEGEVVSFDDFCCAAAAAKMFWLFGMPEAAAAAVRRGESEREAIDMGEGSDIWTSMGESYWVRAREKGVRVVFFGWGIGFEVAFEEEGESRERELRSVDDRKEVEESEAAEECWLSGGGDGKVSFGALRERRWRRTSASTRERTSDSNFF